MKKLWHLIAGISNRGYYCCLNIAYLNIKYNPTNFSEYACYVCNWIDTAANWSIIHHKQTPIIQIELYPNSVLGFQGLVWWNHKQKSIHFIGGFRLNSNYVLCYQELMSWPIIACFVLWILLIVKSRTVT